MCWRPRRRTCWTRSISDLGSGSGLDLLGDTPPAGPLLLDTNVFINALAGRGPPVLRTLLGMLPRLFIAAPTGAELAWVRGRLDPAHPGTVHVLATYATLLSRIDAAQVLVPDDAEWLAAGEAAGRVARAIVGGGQRIATAFDRVELISDALIAIVARRAGVCVVTEDAHFAPLKAVLPGLRVLFYTRLNKRGDRP